MAKTLQVCSVDEQRPIAFVLLDVIHISGQHPRTSFGAFPAKRLSQELRRSQVIRPDRQAVPAMPGHALTAWRLYWLMRCAPSITRQGGTSWISARPKRLIGHGLSPPGKTKSAQATMSHTGHHRLRRWSLWTLAQALRYSRLSLACSACTSRAEAQRMCRAEASGISFRILDT